MSAQQQVERCNRCDHALHGDFCSNCGQPRTLQRINGRYIAAEIGSVLNFDKGILFTIRELLLRPGVNVRKFMLEDRERLVKPVVFIIVCSLIYTLFQQTLGFEDGYIVFSFEEGTATTSIFDWISKNYGYTNILMAVFIAMWIKIFFRRYGYNFFEILILLCFVMGVGMLIFSFFGILDTFIHLKIIDKSFLLGIVYISWGIARFFDKRKIMNYLKGFLSYMLGMVTFTFVAMLLGVLIDLLHK